MPTPARPLGAAVATALVLAACQLGKGGAVAHPAWAWAASLATGICLLWLPGALALAAGGLTRRIDADEGPGLWVATSLGVLTPSAALPFVAGLSLDAAVAGYAVTITVLALAAALRAYRSGDTSLLRRSPHDPAPATMPSPGAHAPLAAHERSQRLLPLLCAVLLVVLAVLAGWLTATGSVDRWWYLAYVRNFLEAPVLDLGEPFLSGTRVLPRFSFHSWLMAMALWSRLSAVDPVWIYQYAAPPLLVVSMGSASLFFARSLFGRGRSAWLAVLAMLLLATGSFFPVVTRMPEDKLFATLVLLPAVAGTALRAVGQRDARWLVALAATLMALATDHALVYAFALALLGPWAVASFAARDAARAMLAAVMALVLAGAVYPAATGLAARDVMLDAGAELSTRDHPVVRVHDDRDRTLQFGHDRYMVAPRFLVHPIVALGLASLPLAMAAPTAVRALLVPATVLPLLFAFVPALAAFTGRFILPWMVYRLLWIVPWGALAALGAERACRALGRGWPLVPLAMVAVVAPWMWDSIDDRLEPDRWELALPEAGPIHDAMAAIAALDRSSIIAAPPEISERIPAVTGRRVLAASDRATIVFSGSRSRGEQRLRARAAIADGTWQAGGAAPTPTHLLLEPGTTAERYCGATVLEAEGVRLCEFLPVVAEAWGSLAEATRRGRLLVSVYDLLRMEDPEFSVSCRPEPFLRPGFLVWRADEKWSARWPRMECRLRIDTPADGGQPVPQHVTLTAYLGRAIDELLISVVGRLDGRDVWNRRAIRRVASDEPVRVALPRSGVDELVVTVTSSFLPFVKLRDIEIGFDRLPPGRRR
jgi:hypothetical protein